MSFSFGHIYNGPEKVVVGIDLGTTMSCDLRSWDALDDSPVALFCQVRYHTLIFFLIPSQKCVSLTIGLVNLRPRGTARFLTILCPCMQTTYTIYLDFIDCSISRYDRSGLRIPSFGACGGRPWCGGGQVVQAPVRIHLIFSYFGKFPAFQPTPQFHEIPSELGFE